MRDEIDDRFTYHPPTLVKADQHDRVRSAVRAVAAEWATDLPAGREAALALTKLEEAVFWANAAIARNP